MKKSLILLTLVIASSSSFSASLDNAQYFNNSQDFDQALKGFDLNQSSVIAGPFMDSKTKEAFIVLQDSKDKCSIVTYKKTKKISCLTAIDKRMLATVPLLEGFQKAEKSVLDKLLSLNGKKFKKEISFNFSFASIPDQVEKVSYYSSLNMNFSEDMKTLEFKSASHVSATTINVGPTLRVRDIQVRNAEGSEEIAIWVDTGQSFYNQSADKGNICYLNPVLANAQKMEDVYHVDKNEDGRIHTWPHDKISDADQIKLVDFNYMVLKMNEDKSELSLELKQTLSAEKDFIAKYSVK